MCGIGGTVNLPLQKEIFSLLRHRGPDSQGYTITNVNDEQVMIAHTRLAIQDLSANGHQPMVDDQERYVLAFNGEIYNHLELRKKLTGVSFKGHSDTETLFHFLMRFGTEKLNELNGIFAFAFLDKQQGTLTLARDRFGVKPLYYCQTRDSLSFGSELKWILHTMPSTSINRQALYNFLRLRYCPSPQTLMDNVYKVSPGEVVQWRLTKLPFETTSWLMSEKNTINAPTNASKALDAYDQVLGQAVERQMLADVPLALLLSGGVDSGLLAHYLKGHDPENLVAYTAGFAKATAADELDEARETAHHLGLEHRPVIMTVRDFFATMRKMVSIVEEPLGSSSLLPLYFLTRAIRRDGYKVALSGQGVDELWGGYFRYQAQQLMHYLPPVRPSGLGLLKKVVPGESFRRGINGWLQTDPFDRLIETYAVFDQPSLNSLFRGGFNPNRQRDLRTLLDQRAQQFNLKNTNSSGLMMGLDLRMGLADELLLYTDKISMHHSIEVRVPFLDHRLVQLVEALPQNHKLGLGRSKILHKRLATRHLPTKIVHRKKKGFNIPLKDWFRTPVAQNVVEDMCSDRGWFGQHFDQRYVRQLFLQHQSGKHDFSKQLFLLSTLFYWLVEMEVKSEHFLVPPAWEHAA